MPGDESVVRDWSGFDNGCQSRYVCIDSAFVNVYHCVWHHLEKAPVLFHLLAASLDGLC